MQSAKTELHAMTAIQFPSLTLLRLATRFAAMAFVATVLLVNNSLASIEALFHPVDPTLEKIAEWITSAESHVDIAMYNMEVSEKSPIIQSLGSPSIQKRIIERSLKIRVIFEGSGTRSENTAKMQALENLGLDVRYLGRAVMVHHKFAVIDSGREKNRVISGSANWSMGSYRGYDENILFFDREPEANDRFQREFNSLWDVSKPFGSNPNFPSINTTTVDQPDLDIHFNSPHRLKSDPKHPLLTDRLVSAIDSARERIDIATTRIRLLAALEAVARAAARGVQVRILIGQDDFRQMRDRETYLDRPGIDLRVKFYNLKPSNFISQQMHNKFMIIDGEKLLTGSFNWSDSSEMNHIENIVELFGPQHKAVTDQYTNRLNLLWETGRDGFRELRSRLKATRSRGQIPPCAFDPISLRLNEIRALLRENPNCHE
jgi:phosphatidylserine/phosphatidylglycerophosphate/cardiolipin synthase-like enzyme